MRASGFKCVTRSIDPIASKCVTRGTSCAFTASSSPFASFRSRFVSFARSFSSSAIVVALSVYASLLVLPLLSSSRILFHTYALSL